MKPSTGSGLLYPLQYLVILKTESSFISQLESNAPTLKQLHCVISWVCVP